MAFIFVVMNLIKCLCLATAATVFYKRSFRSSGICTIIWLLITASACAISTCAISACAIYLNTTLLLALITITGISLNYNWTLIQTCNLYTLVFFFLAFLDILQVFFEERLRYTVIVTFLAAIIQFIRVQPFKTWLREFRAKLGPVYILYGFKSAMLIFEVNISVGCLIFASTFLSQIAGVIFRPDNGVVLSLFRAGVMSDVRKRIHRILMIFSLTWYTVAVLWFYGYI